MQIEIIAQGQPVWEEFEEENRKQRELFSLLNRQKKVKHIEFELERPKTDLWDFLEVEECM